MSAMRPSAVLAALVLLCLQARVGAQGSGWKGVRLLANTTCTTKDGVDTIFLAVRYKDMQGKTYVRGWYKVYPSKTRAYVDLGTTDSLFFEYYAVSKKLTWGNANAVPLYAVPIEKNPSKKYPFNYAVIDGYGCNCAWDPWKKKEECGCGYTNAFTLSLTCR
jgi:hypothetical protein